MENEKRINDFFSKIKNKNLNNDDDVYTELITFERDDNLKNMKDEYVIVSREFSLEERLLLSEALSYYRLLRKNSNIIHGIGQQALMDKVSKFLAEKNTVNLV